MAGRRPAPMDLEQGTITRRHLVTSAGAAGLLAAVGGRRGIMGAAAQGESPAADTEAELSTFNYGGEVEQRIYAEAIARFNERYPNVRVNDNFTPVEGWSDYANKLTTQIAGGRAPDLIHVAIEGTRLLIDKELLEPLNELVAADAEMQARLDEEMAQPLKDAFTVDGQLYQIPIEWNNMVIYYNPKLFAEAGLDPPAAEWTWDDFLAAARALTTGEGGDKVYGFGIPFFTFGLVPWFLTNGTYPLTEDWTASNLNDPTVLETVTFIHDLIHVHGVAPSVEGTDTGQLFSAGKLAMSGWGRWPVSGFLAAEFTDFDVQYWPRKTAATSIHGIGGWGISPSSENKALAWELIREFTNLDTNTALANAGASIPALRSAAETPEFLAIPANAAIFYESLNDTKPVPSPPNFNEFESIFMRHMGEIMSGGASPEDGLKAAHEELSAAMEKLQS
ncbi:MAG: ABC transporter substrate-binding protein [Thermomicrobiales bacterium]